MLSHKRAFFAVWLCFTAETSLSFVFPSSFRFPHLSFAVLMFAALQEGAWAGAKLGLWLGFLLDAVAGERFGFNAAVYGGAGLVCGSLRGMVFAEAFISQWLIPAVAYLGVIYVTTAAYPPVEDLGGFAGYLKAVHGSAFWPTVITSPLVFLACEKTLRTRKTRPAAAFLR